MTYMSTRKPTLNSNPLGVIVTTISSSSNLPRRRDGRWPVWLILALITVMSVGIYLLVSAFTYRIGFPLDDAWIHQTYARNLALRGEWAFNPGIPSGGSTAPLWSALLAVGFLIKLAHMCGPICLAPWRSGSSPCWVKIPCAGWCQPTARVFPGGSRIGVGVASCWAAASGMETLLYALLATAALVLLFPATRSISAWLVDRLVSLGAPGWNYFAWTGSAGNPVMPTFLAKAFAGTGKFRRWFWKPLCPIFTFQSHLLPPTLA